MNNKWISALTAIMCCFPLLLSGCSQAEKTFPSKPVRLIVPYAPGGAADQTARALAASSQKNFGQPITVINKGAEQGPAGGFAFGADAAADGYTVTLITADLATLPMMGQKQVGYQQFEPLICLNVDPVVVAVRTDSPWKNVQDFITYAKANPGSLRVGNAGAGTLWHLAAIALEKKGGVRFSHQSFPGASPALTALVNREIEAVAVSQAESIKLAAAGKIRILGVMSSRPPALLPNVQTMRQQGYDLTLATWRGLAVPKGTPAPIAKRLMETFQAGAQEPSFMQYMAKAGIEMRLLSHDSFYQEIKQQDDFFRSVLSDAGIATQ